MKTIFKINQLLLLRLFYTNPEKSFYMREIGRILGKKPGVFQKTLNNLVKEGLIQSRYEANARYFQADTKNPLYHELKKIVSKTVGVEASLQKLVHTMRDVKIAVLYGSFAKSSERADSDIDLLIVGKPEVEDQLLKKVSQLEKKIRREINYKLYSEPEYRRTLQRKDPFLQEVLRDKKIVLKGNPGAL